MQESLYQRVDVGDTLSDSGYKKTLYQTADAGNTLINSGCRRHSIRQWMQKSLYHTADAGVSQSETDAGDTLSDAATV